MPRSLVVGNGNLLINFNTEYNIRDIYYPYVGMENHTADCVSRTGVWVDGSFSWVDSPGWEKEILYEGDTLVTNVKASNPEVGLTLTFSDLVDVEKDIFMRRVHILNHHSQTRDLRLFFHYELRIMGHDIGDTIYYHPRLKALVMFKYQRYFLASGQVMGGSGISDWTTGSRETEDEQSVLRDPEDGRLGRAPLACGFVEATVGLYDAAVPAKGNSTIYHWLVASTNFQGIEVLNALVQELGPESFIKRTRDCWQSWLSSQYKDSADLPYCVLDLYRRSLLMVRAQMDNRGAIIASSDSDIVDKLKDTYANMWTRDGAFVAMALDMADYEDVSQHFFDFCARTITSDGYFLQKYAPDGSLAGQWMPWADEQGELQLPIQEDETALVLYSLWHHYDRHRNVEFIRTHYGKLIKNAADFMVSYREPHTNLPAPSYDLWEERRAIHSFTVAAVWAALQAAANLMEILGEVSVAGKYRQAAAEIKESVIKYLFDNHLGRFVRSISVHTDGVVEPDHTIDSSICGLFLFGMLQATDPLIENTMAAVIDRLWCKTTAGGMARFENDNYHQVSQDITNIPGNPWFVCTMWVAEYYIARTKSLDDLKPARDILTWTTHCAMSSGILAEQIHPHTCAPLSVSPLTWSHAALVITVNRYIAKYKELLENMHHR